MGRERLWKIRRLYLYCRRVTSASSHFFTLGMVKARDGLINPKQQSLRHVIDYGTKIVYGDSLMGVGGMDGIVLSCLSASLAHLVSS